ncbi:MAG: winged helix-turn-helix transcriptional regulator [Saprospiraceae bacterium]
MKKAKNAEKNCYDTCPVIETLTVIGGKWKPVILWEMERGVLRFGELKRTIPGITQKMLTQQLRELEDDGIIWRKVYAEVPPRVEYGITEYGKTLRTLLNEMARWGSQHQARKSGATSSV